MITSRKAIGLLGGSFDPVHNGHIAIAKSFLDSGFISKLWILLTPDPPHKNKQVLSDFDYRYKMLQQAFRDLEDVEIKEIEKDLPEPSYTIRTLKHMTKTYPEYQFYLCVGEDSIAEFTTWKDWKEILDYCELLVAHRPTDGAVEVDPMVAQKTHYVDHQPVDISSTDIRARVAEGQDISELVPERVLEIIRENNLYR